MAPPLALTIKVKYKRTPFHISLPSLPSSLNTLQSKASPPLLSRGPNSEVRDRATLLQDASIPAPTLPRKYTFPNPRLKSPVPLHRLVKPFVASRDRHLFALSSATNPAATVAEIDVETPHDRRYSKNEKWHDGCAVANPHAWCLPKGFWHFLKIVHAGSERADNRAMPSHPYG